MFNITLDVVNGFFEVGGGLFLCLNIKTLIRDKEIKGVSWSPVVFMTAWGFFNLVFYRHYNHLWSWYGGMFICAVNITWLSLVYYYYRQKKKTEEYVFIAHPGDIHQRTANDTWRKWKKEVKDTEMLMTKDMTDKQWLKVTKKLRKQREAMPVGRPIHRGGLIKSHGFTKRVF